MEDVCKVVSGSKNQKKSFPVYSLEFVNMTMFTDTERPQMITKQVIMKSFVGY